MRRWLIALLLIIALAALAFFALAPGIIERGTNQKTVFYLCTWANVYQAIGEPPPPYAKGGLPVKELAAWYKGLTARDRAHGLRQTGYEVPEYA